jgi:MFS family permease
MSEIAPRKVRGAVVAGYQFCITIGILLANCVVYATQARKDTGSYRIPIAVQFLWAVILAVGLMLLPDSPRYFVKKGKLDQAAAALARVRGQPLDSDHCQPRVRDVHHSSDQLPWFVEVLLRGQDNLAIFQRPPHYSWYNPTNDAAAHWY